MKTAAIELLRRRESRRQYLLVILLILAAYAFAAWSDAQAGDNSCLQGVRVAREAYMLVTLDPANPPLPAYRAAQEYVNKECRQ